MKIIKLIKLILLKLIIRLDEALVEANLQAKVGQVKPNQGYNANRRVDEATSTDAPDKHKAVTGQAKVKLADRRANRAVKADTRRGEKKAKRGTEREDVGQAKRGDKNKGNEDDIKESRGENKSKNVRQATIGNINNDIKGKLEKVEGRITLGYGR